MLVIISLLVIASPLALVITSPLALVIALSSSSPISCLSIGSCGMGMGTGLSPATPLLPVVGVTVLSDMLLLVMTSPVPVGTVLLLPLIVVLVSL